MKNIDAMALVNEMLEALHSKTREQVSVDSIEEVRVMLGILFKDYKLDGMSLNSFEDVFMSTQLLLDTELQVVPNSGKQAIVKALSEIKLHIVNELLKEFEDTDFEFEEGDPTFKLLYEAVQIGGSQYVD